MRKPIDMVYLKQYNSGVILQRKRMMERMKMKQQPKKHNQTRASNVRDWRTCRAVEQIPGKVSGAWVFRGTRVPVRALFENLRDGASIEDFLLWFPGVQREQVEAILNYELESLAVEMN
jgi:uncharacterized protein (DUF433 family)